MNSGKSPAVQAAKEAAKSKKDSNYVELADGRRARLVPVSASLMNEVTSRIKDPVVPMWMNDDKGREEPNPSDPAYLAECKEIENQRTMAVFDAMCMFGVELVDGLPDDDLWARKLMYMSKRGLLDLEDYDLDDELDREFLYKRFIAISTDQIAKIGAISGVSDADVEAAEESFPSSETE